MILTFSGSHDGEGERSQNHSGHDGVIQGHVVAALLRCLRADVGAELFGSGQLFGRHRLPVARPETRAATAGRPGGPALSSVGSHPCRIDCVPEISAITMVTKRTVSVVMATGNADARFHVDRQLLSDRN